MHIRVCRECGEEYRPEIARCTDCGGELEDRHEDETQQFPPGSTLASPEGGLLPDPPDDQTLHVAHRAADLAPLADRLVEAGIDVRIRPLRRSSRSAGPEGYALRVREGDRDRAVLLIAPLIGLTPELRADHAACPACGASLESVVVARESRVCPACDLSAEDTRLTACPRCGGALVVREVSCPSCGLALPQIE